MVTSPKESRGSIVCESLHPRSTVSGVSGSGKIAALDGCIIGTLNTTAAVAGGGGEHSPGTLARARDR